MTNDEKRAADAITANSPAAASEQIVADNGRLTLPRAPGMSAGQAGSDKSKPETEHKDGFREIIETIVFVVVLVLMLKTFLAEAFVIPTGSMAETLFGYHKEVECPECKHRFPVNYSSQADPQDGGNPVDVTGCTCPNCRLFIRLQGKSKRAEQ